jgi:hypothetical protein
MNLAAACFAQSYAEARGLFLAAAQAAGLAVESHAHPLPGRDGEALAMDVALAADAGAPAVLLVTSACHGVEGYCGSGLQVALLADRALAVAARQAGVALVYVHGLNPYGFSWWRRVTHENVDLNRNWHDFSGPLPANPDYDRIAHLLVPPSWPPPPAIVAAEQAWRSAQGDKAWQAAISRGQHHHPQGLFYGGRAPTWSQDTLRAVLRRHARHCARLAWIDIHTGLGPCGHGERIYAGRDDPEAIARARRWWGAEVTSIYDGSSSSALLTGLMWNAAWQEAPQAQYTGIALEYGTLPLDEVLTALRLDQWLQGHPEVPDEQRLRLKRQVRDAFYVDTDDWKQRVVQQGLEATRQAILGLSADRA